MPQQQEILFYLARRENGGAPWVKQVMYNPVHDAHVLEPIVARKNTYAKEHGYEHRYKIVREVRDVVDWVARETERMKTTYKPVPKGLWQDIARDQPYHFLHMGDKPGFIVYTPDEAHGLADKQTACLAGTYLRKFYPTLGVETIDELREIAGEPLESITPHITDDGNVIAKIYTLGYGGPTNSCMSHGLDHWPKRKHPCSLYGKPGNLALAYTMTGETLDTPGNTITARTIINTDKKIWGRTYGYERDVKRLEKWLTKQGYTQHLYTQGGGGGYNEKESQYWAGSTFKTVIKPDPMTPHIDFCKVMHLNTETNMFTLYKKGAEPVDQKPYIVYTNLVYARPVPVCDICKREKETVRRKTFVTSKTGHTVTKSVCTSCFMNIPTCYSCGYLEIAEVPFIRDGNGDHHWCQSCAKENLHTCHECAKPNMCGTQRIYKYSKTTHKRKSGAVRVCDPCYIGLLTKYRKWGVPNF